MAVAGRIEVDISAVQQALRRLDAEERRTLYRWERDQLLPVRDEVRSIMPHRSGALARQLVVGKRAGHAWVGHRQSVRYWGVQEFGGNVWWRPRSGTWTRVPTASGRYITSKGHLIRVRPRAPGESWWLYPTWRKHEPRLVEALVQHVQAIANRSGM